jgi:hypothetical protein
MGHRIAILLFVHSKLGLHSRFLIKHFPDRNGLVPAVFLIAAVDPMVALRPEWALLSLNNSVRQI